MHMEPDNEIHAHAQEQLIDNVPPEEPWLADLDLSKHNRCLILGGCQINFKILNAAMAIIMSSDSHTFIGLREITSRCNFVGDGSRFL